LLDLKKISIRRGRQLLMSDVSFQAHAKQRMGVIGANGSGKTSLFAMLRGELDADEGEFRRDPDDLIAHVAQESPNSSDPAVSYVMDGDDELRTTQSAIAAIEGGGDESRLHSLYEKMEVIDGFTAESRAAKLLHGLGFSASEIQKPVREFSGGWRMRLNLARALMCRSDILLLDEPTNHLDLPAILWLERWLQRYEGILLVISHDRDFLDQVCNRIAHIENRQMHFFTGNYSQFEAQRAEHLAQQQALFNRQQKDIKHIQGFVDRFRYKASKARQAQSRLKMLERMTLIAPAHADSPFRFHFANPGKQPQHLLGLSQADLGYTDSGDPPVLTNVKLNLMAGDRIGLLGVNGAGKSTLVKALASGETMLSGERLLSKETAIGYFAQHQLDLLHPNESPIDHLQQCAPGDKESEMRNYLGRFNFSGDRLFEPVSIFSGGEKARLVLALMIRQEPNLLLLDEPTNHLDLEMRQALSVALIEYTGALVVISHDRHLLRSVCDDLMIVHDGIVDRFARSIDEYPAWLREQDETSEDASELVQPGDKPNAAVSRKQQRQEDARRRQRLKPLLDKVRNVETTLSARRDELKLIDDELGDEAIYQDPQRAQDIADLLKRQATLKADIDTLEWDWLEATEMLEKADGEDGAKVA
jgi:ATP-binding cassette subfamily F protein 3